MDLFSGKPFWYFKNGLIKTYPCLQENIETDVLILGAGISGALIGFHLVKKGIECTIIDKRDVASGSTCASTNLLQYEIDIPLSALIEKIGNENAVTSYLLCRDAIYSLQNISNEIHSSCEFKIKQSIYIASRNSHVADLSEEYLLRKNIGIDLRFLTKQQLKNEYSLEAPAAIVSNDAAELDTYRFTHDIIQWNQKHGVRIFDKTEAKEIQYHKREVKIITTSGNIIKAKRIVFACGYETENYLTEKYGRLHSTYCVVSEPQQYQPVKYLLWETTRPYLYLRSTTDNRMLAGGKDEVFYSPGRRDRLLSRKVNQIVNAVKKKYPEYNFIPDYSWTGTFAETKDALPYIGKHKDHPKGFFSMCYGGNGITFSQVAAEIISDLLEGHKNDATEIFNFYR
jgi:glycine/D-amino acid oxidase-like deaminating enzyme